MKEYYNAKDVMQITGASQALAYRIIRKLKEQFEREFKDAITIQGKIPIWYFEEKMLCKKNKED